MPFKGEAVNDGKMELVLRIFDQAEDGAKIFEVTQVVEVSQGQYFTMVEVPNEILMKNRTVWLEAATTEQKAIALEPRTAFTSGLQRKAAMQANATGTPINGVRFCKTCGFYEFVGAIQLPSGSRPIEYDYQCFGSLTQRIDALPYLCIIGG